MVQSARRGLKDYWQRGKMAPPATSLLHKDFQVSRIWIQVLAVQVKNSHHAQIVISLPLVYHFIFKPDMLVCFLHRIPQLISFAISFFPNLGPRTVMERGGQKRE